jgi:hypothetical protein
MAATEEEAISFINRGLIDLVEMDITQREGEDGSATAPDCLVVLTTGRCSDDSCRQHHPSDMRICNEWKTSAAFGDPVCALASECPYRHPPLDTMLRRMHCLRPSCACVAKHIPTFTTMEDRTLFRIVCSMWLRCAQGFGEDEKYHPEVLPNKARYWSMCQKDIKEAAAVCEIIKMFFREAPREVGTTVRALTRQVIAKSLQRTSVAIPDMLTTTMWTATDVKAMLDRHADLFTVSEEKYVRLDTVLGGLWLRMATEKSSADVPALVKDEASIGLLFGLRPAPKDKPLTRIKAKPALKAGVLKAGALKSAAPAGRGRGGKRVCQNFVPATQSGCHYGDRCHFYHNKQMCVQYSKKGSCKSGLSCAYSHVQGGYSVRR